MLLVVELLVELHNALLEFHCNEAGKLSHTTQREAFLCDLVELCLWEFNFIACDLQVVNT